MDADLKVAKQAIRNFMQRHYTDARLIELLGHARSGRLNYSSCCCFVGIATADHELQTMSVCETEEANVNPDHLFAARDLIGARAAEDGFYYLCCIGDYDWSMQQGRRRLISIILAEIRRRSRMTQDAGAGLGNSSRGEQCLSSSSS